MVEMAQKQCKFDTYALFQKIYNMIVRTFRYTCGPYRKFVGYNATHHGILIEKQESICQWNGEYIPTSFPEPCKRETFDYKVTKPVIIQYSTFYLGIYSNALHGYAIS